MKTFLKQLRPAILIFLAMTVICGALYTGVITGVAQLVFPRQANGSIITVTLPDGTKEEYGSELLALAGFSPDSALPRETLAKYLVGRPMTVSNLSPTADAQKALVARRIDWWRGFDPDNHADIPADLVAGSGSGVDPSVSPEAAEYQVARIAKARDISAGEIRAVIGKYTSGRFLGFIGEPAVNVLKVNLALDKLI